MTNELRQLTIDMKHTFGPEHGKRVLAKLEILCCAHVNQDPFSKGSPDETAYNLGKNRVFRYIKSFVDAEQTIENVSRETCQTEEPTERT